MVGAKSNILITQEYTGMDPCGDYGNMWRCKTIKEDMAYIYSCFLVKLTYYSKPYFILTL